MRLLGSLFTSRVIFSLAILISATSMGLGQTPEGGPDLDAAFNEKIKAGSTKDLDKVVKLCETAIEKGLDKEGEIQAKQLAATSLYEHAEQLAQRISLTGQAEARDRRWRILRTQALSRLKKAVNYDPELIDAYLMMTQLNTLPGGNRAEAIEAIDQAIELASDDSRQKSQALFLRATLQEDQDAQLKDLNEAIEVNPKNVDAIRVRALYYLRRQEPDQAIADLNTWLKSEKKDSRSHIEVVRELMMMGDKFDEKVQAESLEIINRAIENDPENPELLCVRAQLKVVLEEIDAAIADASRALKIEPKNLQALMIRSSLYSDQGKYDDALDDVNEALELRTTEGALRLRGIILSQKGDFTGAIEDIKLLANNDQSNQFYQRQLAMLYNANDQPSKAIRIFNRLLKENGDNSWEGQPSNLQLILMQRRVASLRGRGDSRLSTGEHEGAIQDYEQVMELSDKIRELQATEEMEVDEVDDGVLNNLAWVLATSTKDHLRNGKRAIELATQAAELTKHEEAHILSTLASAYAESGDFKKAIKWIKKAIEANRAAAEKSEDQTRTDKQHKSLQKEFQSYKRKEPWRELQDVEEEKKEKAETKAKEDSEKEDSEKDPPTKSKESDKDSDGAKGKDKETGDKETGDKESGDKETDNEK